MIINIISRRTPTSYSNMKLMKQALFESRKWTKLRNFSSSKPIVIMGIETSCDDTGCAIVDNTGNILSDELHSQQHMHTNNGGIIPTFAQNLHLEHITEVCQNALAAANLRVRDLDAIATTLQPGLKLSLKVGMTFGKYLSKVGNKPFIPIHHMEAHALMGRMVEKIEFPYLVLLISGGHSLLAIVEGIDKFYLLGSTRDDSPGEVFDKIARRLKLKNIPDFYNIGGSAVELAARRATNPEQFTFPVPMLGSRDCAFSFAGIKNSVLCEVRNQERLHDITADKIIPDVYNVCAAAQYAITRHLCHRTRRAMEFIDKVQYIMGNRTLVVSGGVARNDFIAKALNIICSQMGYRFIRPPPKLCTDNGVMIAWNGMEKWNANIDVVVDRDEIEKLDIKGKAPFGVDWRDKVKIEGIQCKMIDIRAAYAN